MLTLRTTFSDRDDLVRYLAAEFPFAPARGASTGKVRGGRQAGLALLGEVSPERYARTRTFLSGDVTFLGPYLRHGLLGLAEVCDRALSRVTNPARAEDFVRNLAWRDYWRRVYERIGDGIWEDIEPYKTGYRARDYEWDLPWDVAAGNTGYGCVDAFLRELVETGYLHHRARTWFAAWLVHERRVRWQAGAQFFLTHLLDGDPASNNLSWQWVASTFSNKPYFFGRDNFERYGGTTCAACAQRSEGCPFGPVRGPANPRFGHIPPASLERRRLPVEPDPPLERIESVPRAIVWLNDDALALDARLAAAAPAAPLVYVFDEKRLRELRWSLKRIVFVFESVLESGAAILRGPVVPTLAEFAAANGAERIVTRCSPDPWIKKSIEASALPALTVEAEPFVLLERRVDLRRFEPYWRSAKCSFAAREAAKR